MRRSSALSPGWIKGANAYCLSKSNGAALLPVKGCGGRCQMNFKLLAFRRVALLEAGGALRYNPAPSLRKEFFRAIPVDQLKSVWQIRECRRRCRQGLVNRAVTTFMRIVRLFMPIQFPANEEK
jgi:hypothetical protein